VETSMGVQEFKEFEEFEEFERLERQVIAS
jgi:hypothetical protein